MLLKLPSWASNVRVVQGLPSSGILFSGPENGQKSSQKEKGIKGFEPNKYLLNFASCGKCWFRFKSLVNLRVKMTVQLRPGRGRGYFSAAEATRGPSNSPGVCPKVAGVIPAPGFSRGGGSRLLGVLF
jgi:hypothetical protein